MNRSARTEVAISRFVADRLECGSIVVYHGIEPAEAVAAGAPAVAVIQRLEAEKHTEVALRAWEASGLAAQGWHLVVAGDGAARPGLERLAEELGISPSVRFLGRVSDVEAVRAGAAIQLASPPAEPFGLSVLEAMACGLPVIAADGGAHRELLGEEPALLFPVDDHATAAARLWALASDVGERLAAGARLRQRQRERFSLEAHGRAMEHVYLDALEG